MQKNFKKRKAARLREAGLKPISYLPKIKKDFPKKPKLWIEGDLNVKNRDEF